MIVSRFIVEYKFDFKISSGVNLSNILLIICLVFIIISLFLMIGLFFVINYMTEHHRKKRCFYQMVYSVLGKKE